MCASSDDSPGPAHEWTLCSNDGIEWVYKWSYLLLVMFNEISTFIASACVVMMELNGSINGAIYY